MDGNKEFDQSGPWVILMVKGLWDLMERYDDFLHGTKGSWDVV
jgi:hypothetical protein